MTGQVANPEAEREATVVALQQRHVGIGWRQPHYAELLQRRPPLAFLEVHSENFFADGGAALALLDQGRAAYPISLHGVGLALGSAAGLDPAHLDRLATLVARVAPVRVSDHAAFARAPWAPGGPVHHAADLLPPAFTEASLAILADNVQRVQDRLQRPILVENLSAYVRWADDSLAEADYFNALTRRTGCGLLLDLNNLVVNALNAGLEPVAAACRFVDAVDPHSVGEIHLAGYAALPDITIDDHGSRVHPPVWQVFAHALRRLGPRPTLLEWDTDVPALDVLLDEAHLAAQALARAQGPAHLPAQLPAQSPSHLSTRLAEYPPEHPLARLPASLSASLSATGVRWPRPGLGAAEPAAHRGTEPLRQQLMLRLLWRQAPPGTLQGWLRCAPQQAQRGLRAYQANGQAMAQRALAAAYPTVAQAVGDEALATLACALWWRHPPQHADLALWGADLPHHLAGEAELADWPWLPDLARLDWAVHRCEAAADAANGAANADGAAARANAGAMPPGLDGLAAADAPERCLRLKPGLALVGSAWPVATLWQAHQDRGDDRLAPARAALAQGLSEQALVWRDSGWRIRVQALPAGDARFMLAVLQGHTLGQALAAAGEGWPFEPWLLAALRHGWIDALQGAGVQSA